MGKEVVLLEELAKYPHMMMNQSIVQVEILSENSRRINGHCFEIIYDLKVMRDSKPHSIIAEIKPIETELKPVENTTKADVAQVISDDDTIQEQSSDADLKNWASQYVEFTKNRTPIYREPIRFKRSHEFLPHERDILNNELYIGLTTFTIDETLTIDNNAEFPSSIIKQLLGKGYDQVKKGNRIKAFKIMYNMNYKSDNKFCGGIIIPDENCDVISYMAKYSGCSYGNITGFFDHHLEKDCLNVECVGTDQFRIVYDKNEPILRNQVVVVNCHASDDFYMRLDLISQVKNRKPIRIDKEIIPQKSPYKKGNIQSSYHIDD